MNRVERGDLCALAPPGVSGVEVREALVSET
jgi:hypothetical protein